MSGSAGPEGYADWQRVDNWDSPILREITEVERVGSFTTPIFNISRYGYIAGVIGAQLNPVNIEFGYAMDETFTRLAGFRSFVSSPNITRKANIRIPNLGPYCRITFNPLNAGQHWRENTIVFGTNRISPMEFFPSQALLIKKSLAAIGASETQTIYPTDYFAGPAQLFATCNKANFSLTLSVQQIGGSDILTLDQAVPGAGAIVERSVLLPPGAWYVQVGNGTAEAGLYDLTVLASLTGST